MCKHFHTSVQREDIRLAKLTATAANVNRVQELRESQGGRPGLSVLMSLTVYVDVKPTLNRASALVTVCP